MNKEFIPYEQALELKELGFEEKCLAYYWLNIDAIFRKPFLCIEEPFDDEWCLPSPLYQQAFRFFREKYDLKFFIEWDYDHYNAVVLRSLLEKFNTYEEAELACLKKLIELVKNK